ncbi:MAG: TonB-dependent receptor plug domain-containing protein [Sphingomicrobium sp.]
MKLDFRQRLLSTTLLVGASMIASPVLAQTTPPAPAQNPPDNSGTPTTPETTAPLAGTTPPSTNAQGGNVKAPQEIIITGTRIPQPNLTSASPVTVLSAQEVKLQGTTRTEDLINSLPQAFAAQGSNVSNGATGTATVNLRGLGPARTLVLVNGKRLQPGSPVAGGDVPDINFVPSALIKRVDVLTGGASSVYGADAVAGVVNFIMDTNYRGFRIDGQASVFQHDNRAGANILNPNNDLGFRPPRGMSTNGGSQDIAGVFGAGFDDNRGSIVAYATYRNQGSVLQATRDYSFCSFGANPAYTSAGSDFYCGGSSTDALGRFRFFSPVVGTVSGSRKSHTLGPNAPNGSGTFVPGFALFNFAPYNYFQRPDERYTFGTFAEYEISPGAKPYLEAMFMHDHTDAQIAPSGDFGNTTFINCDNALMSPSQLAAVCKNGNFIGQSITTDSNGVVTGITGTPTVFTDPTTGATFNRAHFQINRRNVEGGGRDDDLEHTDYRIVLGMRGDLLRGLSYDAYYQYGTSRRAETYFNDFSVTRLNRAIDVVANPAGPNGVAGVPVGAPVCRSALGGAAAIDPNCVPWNVFAQGAVTPAALNYLQTPGFQRGNVSEQIADANFTFEGGEYGLQTPWADRGIGINVGGEYRKESLKFATDVEFSTGDLAGQGGPTLPTAGTFDVKELFTEIQVPIISHSFIEDFTITGGYRYSKYNIRGGSSPSTDTYKISAELAPIRDIRFRASYNRAVRAPNIIELFFPAGLGLSVGVDFCAGAHNGFTTAQCLNTFGNAIANGSFTVASATALLNAGGIDANPANQYGTLFSGNANLTPEKADTYTAGVVIQPRWVPGLALTVDYFNIKVKNLISPLSFNGVLATCALTANPALCGLINRDSFGSLTDQPSGFVNLQTVNVGGLQTKGFDFNGSYAHKFSGLGTLNVSFVGTWLRHLIFDTGINPNALGLNGVYDCAGFFGATCSFGSVFTSPNPKWRHKLRVGFTLPNGLGISGQWRYFSSVKNDTLSNDADLNFGEGPHSFPGDAKIPAQSFFDLALTARITDRYNFRLGANNIFDKSPPVLGGDVSANGNTFPQMYDSLGRFIFAGFTVDF